MHRSWKNTHPRSCSLMLTCVHSWDMQLHAAQGFNVCVMVFVLHLCPSVRVFRMFRVCAVAMLLRGAKRRHEEFGSPPRSLVPRRRSRPSYYDDEAFSPHGKKTHEVDLPEEFMVTQDCYDARPQGGRKLFKTVQPTQWSRDWGLAGKRIEEITLPQLSWLGWENWGLRSLSAGSYTSLVFARSVREGQLLDQLQRELRSRHVDVESAAIQWAQHENVLPKSSSGASSVLTREDKNEAMSKFVGWIADQVQKWNVSAVEGSQQARIQELERQLTEMREAQASGSSNPNKRKVPDKPPGDHGERLTVDDVFQANPPKKPLRTDCPSKAGTSSVTAWLKKLPQKTQDKAMADYKSIEPMMKTWDEDQLTSLRDIAAAWGLPVSLAASMGNKDLVRVIVTAHTLAK